MTPDEVPRSLRDGRYELEREIGRGGMATVWRARDVVLGVARAVKVVRPEPATLESFRRRLYSEARAMAKLEHPYVLSILDVGTEGEFFYVVMPLAERGSVQDRLRDDGPVPWLDAARYTIQILAALSTAHSLEVIHRDVKPQNILLGSQGQALLADFGIALLAETTHGRATVTGASMGSPSFMPPEQRIDARSVDHRADLYSAGATFYAMVTRRTPVDLYTAKPQSPRWKGVPAAFVPVLRKATAMRPEERYFTALEFAVDLLTAAAQEGGDPQQLLGSLRGPGGELLFADGDDLDEMVSGIFAKPPPVQPNLPPSRPDPRTTGARWYNTTGHATGAARPGASRLSWQRVVALAGVFMGSLLLTGIVVIGLSSERTAALLEQVRVASSSMLVGEAIGGVLADTDGSFSPSGASEDDPAAAQGAKVSGEGEADESGDRRRRRPRKTTVDDASEAPSVQAPAPTPSATGTSGPSSPAPATKEVVPTAPAAEKAAVSKEVTPAKAASSSGPFREWQGKSGGKYTKLTVSGSASSIKATLVTDDRGRIETRRLIGTWDAPSNTLNLRDTELRADRGSYALTLAPDAQRLSGLYRPEDGGTPRLMSLAP